MLQKIINLLAKIFRIKQKKSKDEEKKKTSDIYPLW